ncbi:MAG: methyltransferase domain-containing protein [Thermoplasma acidophilum]|nr:methyltransferase domain-containing protein [Thermoplasma acidophilum]
MTDASIVIVMKDTEDAFGHALKDYADGKCSYEMVETRSGKIDVTSISYYFLDYDQWPSMERDAIRYAYGRIVDVGAGAGRHSLYLQDQGFDVTALDISPLAVEVMKHRGVKNVRLAGIDEVEPGWNTMILLGNNFGLMRTIDEARAFLRRFHSESSDDARIIAETTDPFSAGLQSDADYPGELEIRLIYREYRSEWFRYLLADRQKLREIVEDTGWKIEHIYDMAGVDVYCFVLSKRGSVER